MNKQLTKKTIGIAASAALMATVLSTTAVEANPNKGPKASIDVLAVCSLDVADPMNAILGVRTLITEEENAEVAAVVVSNTTQAIQGVGNNRGKNKFSLIGDAVDGPLGTDPVGNEFTIQINLCDAGLASNANSADALVTVEIAGGHKTFSSRCGDDPMTEEVEGSFSIGHLGLCPQN